MGTGKAAAECAGFASEERPTTPITAPVLVACKRCDTKTMNAATRKCDLCWEVESRLADYLRRGGIRARVFVLDVLMSAIEEARR